MIKSILVALDGSQHAQSGDASTRSGSRSGCRRRSIGLHVVDVVSIEGSGSFLHDVSGSLGFEPYLDFSSKMREALQERGRTLLESFLEACRERGVRADTHLATGIVANEVCELRAPPTSSSSGIAASTRSSRPGSSAARPRASPASARSRCFVDAGGVPADHAAAARLRRQSARRLGDARGGGARAALALPLTVLHVGKDERRRQQSPRRGPPLPRDVSHRARVSSPAAATPTRRILDVIAEGAVRSPVHRRVRPQPHHRDGARQHHRVRAAKRLGARLPLPLTATAGRRCERGAAAK